MTTKTWRSPYSYAPRPQNRLHELSLFIYIRCITFHNITYSFAIGRNVTGNILLLVTIIHSGNKGILVH